MLHVRLLCFNRRLPTRFACTLNEVTVNATLSYPLVSTATMTVAAIRLRDSELHDVEIALPSISCILVSRIDAEQLASNHRSDGRIRRMTDRKDVNRSAGLYGSPVCRRCDRFAFQKYRVILRESKKHITIC